MNNDENVQVDELTDVPTAVLGAWVADQGRCLWEFTIAKAPEWAGEPETDRIIATRMCAGCPVRAECLELESRAEWTDTDGVREALHPQDRRVLEDVWSARDRSDVAATVTDAGDRA